MCPSTSSSRLCINLFTGGKARLLGINLLQMMSSCQLCSTGKRALWIKPSYSGGVCLITNSTLFVASFLLSTVKMPLRYSTSTNQIPKPLLELTCPSLLQNLEAFANIVTYTESSMSNMLSEHGRTSHYQCWKYRKISSSSYPQLDILWTPGCTEWTIKFCNLRLTDIYSLATG